MTRIACIAAAVLAITNTVGGTEAGNGTVARTEIEFKPYDVVGVCAVTTRGRNWAVVWHPTPSGADPEKATRVFKELESPEVDACLTRLIETDPSTLRLVSSLGPSVAGEAYRRVTDAVRARWTGFGVGRAIVEVANTGQRGKEVAEVLDACKHLSSAAGGAGIDVPEHFFLGTPRPDNSIDLWYENPHLLDPESVANQSGWWNACAKMAVLLEKNLEFRQVYEAARKDPALGETHVTYVEWSRATLEVKEVLREHLATTVAGVVAKYHLVELLKGLPVDETLLSLRRAQLEQAMAKALGIVDPSSDTLVRYCPGSPANISINGQHPFFPRLQKLLEEPAVAGQYRSIASDFGKYLDAHPSASIKERDAEILRLMKPILSRME